MSRAETARLARTLLRWYAAHGRALPWRATRNPYRILLSEIMLQQTQVRRVLVSYPRFLRRFPTLASIARAEQHEVVTLWRGMGYNNRAVRLHRLARMAVSRHRGRVPDQEAALHALPGVGPYTASAVRASAFGHPVAVVDVNVRRVLSRVFFRMPSISVVRPEREIARLATRILPGRRAHDWNQALMDLGATVCTARAPACSLCPVASWCRSRQTMSRTGVQTVRREPSRRGIPNRIYRGRVIDLLRSDTRRRGIPATAVGKAVVPGFSEADRDWLGSLLAGLERDGLVDFRDGGRRIALR